MNIKRTKEEIKNTIEAYLLRDEYGEYEIPVIRQRPSLLLGSPGIGKTQIIGRDLDISRQSGVHQPCRDGIRHLQIRRVKSRKYIMVFLCIGHQVKSVYQFHFFIPPSCIHDPAGRLPLNSVI